MEWQFGSFLGLVVVVLVAVAAVPDTVALESTMHCYSAWSYLPSQVALRASCRAFYNASAVSRSFFLFSGLVLLLCFFVFFLNGKGWDSMRQGAGGGGGGG